MILSILLSLLVSVEGVAGTHINLPPDADSIDNPEVFYLMCLDYNEELPDVMYVCDKVTRKQFNLEANDVLFLK